MRATTFWLACLVAMFLAALNINGNATGQIPYPFTTTTTTTKPTPKPKPTTTTTSSTTTTTQAPKGSQPLTPGETGRNPIEARVRWKWGSQGERAARTVCGESGFDPHSKGGENLGLFQINWPSHKKRAAKFGYGREDMFDAEKNITVAYDIWKDSGWHPWSGYSTKCW